MLILYIALGSFTIGGGVVLASNFFSRSRKFH